ncbi:hypothetical protein IKN40_02840 [bacterium]|nr:hypothetical protein [bacterium]
MLTEPSNCAVYVAGHVTLEIAGLHALLNVYENLSVLVFVGTAHEYSGVSSYSTCSLFSSSPSQSNQIISYLFIVSVN